MQVEEIIDIIDDYLISTGKHFIGLRAANDLLIFKGNREINLKGILEKNEIPHAYQTETKPKQWRIPHSNENVFKEKRKEFLKNYPKPNPVINSNTSKSFNYKTLIIVIIIGVIFYSLFSDSKQNDLSPVLNDSNYYINTQAFAIFNKSDFDDMYDCVIHNDTKALQQMLDFGKITILKKGTGVYIINASLGYDVIRQKGSTQKLWVAAERVSKQ